MTQTTVRYFVTNVDEAIDFYCMRFGFHVDLPLAPGCAGLAKVDLRLLLHEPGVGGAGKAGGAPTPGGWNRFQIVADDLDATVERLATQGAAFRGEIVEGPGGRQILIEDPSGNPVELFQPKSTYACRERPGHRGETAARPGKVGWAWRRSPPSWTNLKRPQRRVFDARFGEHSEPRTVQRLIRADVESGGVCGVCRDARLLGIPAFSVGRSAAR